MSEPGDEAQEELREGRGLRWAVAIVGTVVGLLLVYLVLLIPTGTSLIPGTTTGDSREANLQSLRNAANQQLGLFINQDYRTARTTMNALIDGATGKFKSQLVGSLVTEVNAAGELHTVATGKIKAISVTKFDGTDATLLAVVSQKVTNAQTKKTKKSTYCSAGSVCPQYNLVLTYQRVSGQWKMSNLEYLPL